ncbi:hypothetical protein, conserved [Trypanosoma brucei gambiense DAL972]|uniref:Diacylglycerol kinase n=1 Tax=Trypanosoma brucei gambiense (strain MHOM/CI/86/DAL972) TaxID=679716 RepID=C9ZVX0_TRYB9|nr:hypothetical protein, conserved [Trypanosoma brucei gambiense DAL972]CBH13558.1 hypothetical protein, conserved [Trypanosoma brucei gambiense DAL972]|eukprot:XP_011775835.1 hypothetical protein, conserved [Trypanosoma brucei gambiense DAL972]
MSLSNVVANNAMMGVHKNNPGIGNGNKSQDNDTGKGGSDTDNNAETTEQKTHYQYVLAIVNPLAGETGTSGYITENLVSFFGEERVVLLNKDLFADPAPLHEAIRKYAVRYMSDEEEEEEETKGTEVDVRLPTDAVDDRGTVFVSGGDGTVSYIMDQMDAVREIVEKEVGNNARGEATPRGKPIFPALAVLAFGTGNDFSNCVGFGRGYSRGGKCGPLCKEDLIEHYVQKALTARSTPFDRWVMQVVPMSVACRQNERAQQGDGGEEEEPQSPDGQKSSVTQGGLHDLFIDWDALTDDPDCKIYRFINYVSVGFDAYVTHRFSTFRKNNPKFCSKRWRNKAVYCCFSFRAAVSCSPLKGCVPSVWVSESTCGEGGYVSPAGSGSHMTNVQLPSGSKTLMLTNVTSYAAGTKPWNAGSGKLYRKGSSKSTASITPVCVNDRKLEVQTHSGLIHMGMMQMNAGKGANKISQTNDVIFFVSCCPEDIYKGKHQQPPAREGEGKQSKMSLEGAADNLKKESKESVSLYVQLDGEPIMIITTPSIVRIRELRTPRVYVRCLNEDVLLESPSEEGTEGEGA